MLENLIKKNLPENEVNDIVQALKDTKQNANNIVSLMSAQKPSFNKISMEMTLICQSYFRIKNLSMNCLEHLNEKRFSYKEILSFYKSICDMDYDEIYNSGSYLIVKMVNCFNSLVEAVKYRVDTTAMQTVFSRAIATSLESKYNFTTEKPKKRRSQPKSILDGYGCIFDELKEEDPYIENYIDEEIFFKKSIKVINQIKKWSNQIYNVLTDENAEFDTLITLIVLIILSIPNTGNVEKETYRNALQYENFNYHYMSFANIINFFDDLSDMEHRLMFNNADHIASMCFHCLYSLLEDDCEGIEHVIGKLESHFNGDNIFDI